jgi:hypothetical protein
MEAGSPITALSKLLFDKTHSTLLANSNRWTIRGNLESRSGPPETCLTARCSAILTFIKLKMIKRPKLWSALCRKIRRLLRWRNPSTSNSSPRTLQKSMRYTPRFQQIFQTSKANFVALRLPKKKSSSTSAWLDRRTRASSYLPWSASKGFTDISDTSDSSA